MQKTEQHIILNDQRRLCFAEFGHPEGFPIIYFHGSQSSRLEMHYDMSFAVTQHLRVITIDRPGHGISDFNPEGTILSFAHDVKHLTEFLNIERFSVIGMSAGSAFALGFTYLFPKNIYKTSIVSSFAPYNKDSKKHLNTAVKSMLTIAKHFPFLLKFLLKTTAKQINTNPKKALGSFLKIMSEPDKNVLKNDAVSLVIETMFKEAYRNGSEGIAHEISNILVKDWGFSLEDIQTPVTLWQGKKDNNVPYKWAELMKSKMNNATLKLYKDEGHLLIFNFANEIFTALKANPS
ncbi:alpha/beta hydrolase [Winogradskyella eckloniae]|uniref:alpha/beta fold hydrolase n=1 Tax=Winogradskyella eckloniae TaxID=1089306 RepID=UPI001564AC49|nr:alpha/beta hydrolase [Winogradskyella eckloniae]NRD20608.1 alpha/beta hydrolase [Winogradskyella eckloniae]